MKLTSLQAGEQLREHAATIQAQRGCSFDEAWQAARTLHPDLIEALHADKPTVIDHRAGPINHALSNERAVAALNDPKRQAANTSLHQIAAERHKKIGGDYADAFSWAKEQNVALANDAAFNSGKAKQWADELIAFYRERTKCTEAAARAWLVEKHSDLARLAEIS